MKKPFVHVSRYYLPFVFLIMVFIGCKKNKTEEPSPIAIGNQYQGGTIFYLDNTGQHGLVVTSLTENPAQGWGCFLTDIPETSATFGAGQTNTAAILAHCSEPNIAARLCDNLATGGYTDWFMPSKDELQLVYTNLHQHGMGGFVNHTYWTSTEHSPSYAWEIDFANGVAQRGSKGNSYQKVLAVRAF
jgi:hypothetical protein